MELQEYGLQVIGMNIVEYYGNTFCKIIYVWRMRNLRNEIEKFIETKFAKSYVSTETELTK